MSGKKWGILFLCASCICLVIISATNIFIDPFFHYHKPLAFLEYPMEEERYRNDGITRYYEYDAIITGTSMTQNFRTSQMEELFDCKAIKVSNSGATFVETAQNMKRAFSYNPGIKYVLMSIDVTNINRDADEMEYTGYPEYLYDNNPINDTLYFLNLEVLFKSLEVINYTRAGYKTVSMDMYQNFDQWMEHGREHVLASWYRVPEESEEYILSEEEYQGITDNIRQNICQMALEHPDTEFFFFFPPYSICYWDYLVRSRQLHAEMEMKKLTCEQLFTCPNAHVFDFTSHVELIEDLDNYSDVLHYSAEVNDYIMQRMADGEDELTSANYSGYFDEIEKIIAGYDYSKLVNE